MYLKIIGFFCALLIAAAERVLPGSSKNVEQSKRNGKIIGATEAAPHEFPHMVSLHDNLGHFCGGAILNENWVVTAGHCKWLAPVNKTFQIRAGEHSLKKVENTEQVINVDKVFVHESYPGGRVVAANDIALLKLEKPLKFNQYVQAIALPAKGSEVNGTVLLSGWGHIENFDSPQKLRRAESTVIDFDTCQQADIKASGPPSAVEVTNLCTGLLPGPTKREQVFACNGDSGGPLIKQANGKAQLVGVFSWLANPCGKDGAPSVFTKVSAYVDWIEDTMANN